MSPYVVGIELFSNDKTYVLSSLHDLINNRLQLLVLLTVERDSFLSGLDLHGVFIHVVLSDIDEMEVLNLLRQVRTLSE